MSEKGNGRNLTMKVSFLGAVGNDVTGSATLLEICLGSCVRKILIDCGMFQGEDMVERAEVVPINPKEIDAVVLTHAHLDHSGEIPYLYKIGYEGEVYASHETLVQAKAIMYDCANINKKNISTNTLNSIENIRGKVHRKANQSKENKLAEQVIDEEQNELFDLALYLAEDVDEAVKHFHDVEPLKMFKLFEGVHVRFLPSTHQNGATIVEVYAQYQDQKKAIAFSGDIGPAHSYLYREMEYEPNENIDYCVVESLHGVNTPEETFNDSVRKLKKLIRKTVLQENRSLYIGVFALDRSALLLAILNGFIHSGMNFELWFDSPLGEIQLSNYINSYENKKNLWFRDFTHPPFDCRNVEFSTNYKSHMELVRDSSPKVVLVTSCMGYGGRILDYFRAHIQDEKSVFAFAGYLPEEAPSNKLHVGEKGKIVEVNGDRYVKHCDTVRFHGFSSHGYYQETMDFVNMYPNLKCIFLNHAPHDEKEDVKSKMQEEVQAEIFIPEYDETYFL